MENTYVICIGSNSNATENVEATLESLRLAFGTLKTSRFIKTRAINSLSKNLFTNGLVSFDSRLSYHDLKSFLKDLEKKMGRTPLNKQKGVIPIDIDIIMCNSTVLSIDYERSYVQELMSELT